MENRFLILCIIAIKDLSIVVFKGQLIFIVHFQCMGYTMVVQNLIIRLDLDV